MIDLERFQKDVLAINGFIRSMASPIGTEPGTSVNDMVSGIHLDVIGTDDNDRPLLCLKVPKIDQDGVIKGEFDVFYSEGEDIDSFILYTQGVFHGLYMMATGASIVSAQLAFPRDFADVKEVDQRAIATMMSVYRAYAERFSAAFEDFREEDQDDGSQGNE